MTEECEQAKAIQLIQKGQNLFLTGSGGVGKSYVINQVKTRDTIVVAPTGIAAMNVGGGTCHSVFGLPIGLPSERDKFAGTPKLQSLLSTCDKVIIDEISMVRVDILNLIDKKFKNAMGNNKPFGGVQVVVVGDFYQLEPIVSSSEAEYFYDEWDTPFAFDCPVWDTFEQVELTKVYRQEDTYQINLLNTMRKKSEGWRDALEEINSITREYDRSGKSLHLCCYNKDADKINRYWYEKNKNQEHTFYAIKEGFMSERDYPVPHELTLKKGLEVLICANDAAMTYVNGDRGIVQDITPEGIFVSIDGRIVLVKPFTWEKIKYNKRGGSIQKDVVASFQQYPIKLGYAISIHKSQGMSLQEAALHLGKGCFGHGQLYVGLSRIRDLKNLSLVRPIKESDLIVRGEVIQYFSRP